MRQHSSGHRQQANDGTSLADQQIDIQPWAVVSAAVAAGLLQTVVQLLPQLVVRFGEPWLASLLQQRQQQQPQTDFSKHMYVTIAPVAQVLAYHGLLLRAVCRAGG